MLFALPSIVVPKSGDLGALLPEIVLAIAFVLLMILDLFTIPAKRGWLAAFTLVAILSALLAVVWGWFDAEHPRTVYFGSFAYDRFSLFIDAILLVSAGLVLLVSPQYLNRRQLHYGEYYALIVGALIGMMLLAGAASLMVVFLGIELLSIALYVLSGFARQEGRSQEAALKYLLLGGFASGFLLYGMALIYGETGHTQFSQIAAAIDASASTDPLLMIGVVLLFVGLAFKISAAPFHMWTPDVYQGAPVSVTAFMSVATKTAAFAATIRILTYTLPDLYPKWNTLIVAIAIASMVVGNIAALTQTSIKRMLAYSGIAQAGYMLIGVAVLGPSGTVAVLYYLAAYTAANLGAFAVITIMSGKGEDLDSYESIRGLAFRRPYVAAVMVLFLLSLAGFPPTAGFVSKFLVFSAAVQSDQLRLALWGVATSVIAVFYYLRVGFLMYSEGKSEREPNSWPKTSVAGATTLGLAAAGTLVLGIFVALVYSFATSAQQGIAT